MKFSLLLNDYVTIYALSLQAFKVDIESRQTFLQSVMMRSCHAAGQADS